MKMRYMLRRRAITRELAFLRLEATALRAAAVIIEASSRGDAATLKSIVDAVERRIGEVERGRYAIAVAVGFILGVMFSTVAYIAASVG